MHIGMQVNQARVDIGFMSLADLIPMAFDVKPYQVTAPEWLRESRFDILAKAEGNPTPDQERLMLRTLLAERFALSVHVETRELPLEALLKATQAALKRSKKLGKNSISTAEAADFH